MIALATTSTNPVVHVYRNQVTTSSLDVADYFGKQHKSVLRAIQNLECSEEFRRLNFAPSSYVNEQNKKQPCFEITKDGFTMLAFGFTGKKAAEFKERYINAFNRMLEGITPDRQEAIKNKRAAHRGMTDAVKEVKQQEGKEAKVYHFINENLLCNEAAFGIRKAIDESALTAPAAKLLERVRNYNEILIREGLTLNARKLKLTAYADIQRRYLMPIKAIESRQTGLGK
jgi:Rha family phage regulatory protein